MRAENLMKSREQTNTERFSKALATLRQKVDAVLKRAPNLMVIDRLEEIPDGQSKAIEDDLWGILLYGKYYVAKVRVDLNDALLTVKNRGKNYAFYESEYPAFIEKACKLTGASNLPSTEAFERDFVEYFDLYYNDYDCYDEFIWDDNTLDDYESHVQIDLVLDRVRKHSIAGCASDPLSEGDEKVKDSFALAVEAVEYVANCHRFIYKHFGKFEGAGAGIPNLVLRKDIIDENTHKDLGFHRQDCFDFDPPEPFAYQKIMQNCNHVAQQFWFNPDAWLANERAISPVIVARDSDKISRHIKERIDEIHQSFVFSNWMSAIALSRCLLEYALIDRKPLFEKRLGRKIDIRVNKMRAKPISDLVDIASEAFPELGESMGIVVEYGHEVMHPFRRVIPSRNRAKHCVDEIGKIIGTLYSVNS